MKQRLVAVVWFVVVAGAAAPASPAGFALIEQSVRGLGNAFAGGAAACADASTVFFNPAGMTRLDGQDIVAGVNFVIPSAQFSNDGSTHALQPITSQALTGGNSGDAGSLEFVPNFYYSLCMENGLAFGVGVNAPFALSTEYDADWVGRYHAIESRLKTININPSLAYRLNDRVSIGVGFSAQYMDVTLSNAIDFGTLDAVGAFAPLPAGALGLTPQGDDGTAVLEGDHWGFGFNAGVLVEVTGDTRVGVAYRSRVRHDVEGTADFSAPAELAPVQAATGLFTDTGASSAVKFPDYGSLSLYHRVSDRWALMGDVSFTHWSLFEELRFRFDSGQPDGVTTEKWEDSWRYALGVTFDPDDAWSFRAGVAFDESPIPGPERRTPRIPTNDRYWTSLGAGHRISERISADVGFAHLFVPDPEIDKAALVFREDRVRGGLRGAYDASVDIIAVQVRAHF